jgi:hypothetical protein
MAFRNCGLAAPVVREGIHREGFRYAASPLLNQRGFRYAASPLLNQRGFRYAASPLLNRL